MTGSFFLWFLIGLLAGAAHVWLLWRGSQPPFRGAAFHFPRILLVGGVFFASAILGGLLPAIAGWMLGYFPAVAMVATRKPT
jgi:hypothetical protein